MQPLKLYVALEQEVLDLTQILLRILSCNFSIAVILSAKLNMLLNEFFELFGETIY